MSRNTLHWAWSAMASVAVLAQAVAYAEETPTVLPPTTTAAKSTPIKSTPAENSTEKSESKDLEKSDAKAAPTVIQNTSFSSVLNNTSLAGSGCGCATNNDCGCGAEPICGLTQECGCGVAEDCCCRQRRWFGGVEATYLAPDIRGSNLRIEVTNNAGPTTNTYTGENLDSFTAAPRVWLGLQGECYGVVARYWNMDGSEATFDPFGVTGPGVTSFGRVEATTFDLEVTRQFTRRCTDMTASFGARYAEWDNTEGLVVSEVTGADLHLGTAAASRRFEGVGLTGGVNGLRPIGCGNWNLFWNARASLLWGDTEQLIETIASAQGPGGAAASINGANAQTDDDLFVGELQIGVQRDFALQCLPATAFFRAAFEYQYWDANAGFTTSTSGATASAAGVSNSTVSAGGLRMELYGIAIAAGFDW